MDFVRCYFCGKRACVKGKECEVDMFRISSVMRLTGQVLYSTMKLKVPRCSKCRPIWFEPGKLHRHPFVREEQEAGWKIGTQPSEADIAEFVRRYR